MAYQGKRLSPATTAEMACDRVVVSQQLWPPLTCHPTYLPSLTPLATRLLRRRTHRTQRLAAKQAQPQHALMLPQLHGHAGRSPR